LYLFINAYLLFMQQVINYSLDFLVFRSLSLCAKCLQTVFGACHPLGKAGAVERQEL